jgi:hypothetical protein
MSNIKKLADGLGIAGAALIVIGLMVLFVYHLRRSRHAS